MFYPLPETIETSVYTTMPEELRIRDRVSGFLKARPEKTVDAFLEGPSFDRQGNLYVVDVAYGRILRITPEREWQVAAEYDGWPNGLAIHKDGRIFIADHKNGVMVLDPISGKVEPFLTDANRESFKGLNDICFGLNGDLYFTDQGETSLADPTGRVYRLRADGKLICMLGNIPGPNGLALSADEKILFVTASKGKGIWAIPISPNGEPTKVQEFIHLQAGMTGGDGMKMMANGGLAIAQPSVKSVWLFDKLGIPMYRVLDTGDNVAPTNFAFGGPENKTIFITESRSSSITMANVPIAGMKLYSHAD